MEVKTPCQVLIPSRDRPGLMAGAGICGVPSVFLQSPQLDLWQVLDAPCVDPRPDPHTKVFTVLRPPGGIYGQHIRPPSPGLPRAEMIPRGSLSPPLATHFPSQMVGPIPRPPDLGPLRPRPSPARTPEREAGVGGGAYSHSPASGLSGLTAGPTWMPCGLRVPLTVVNGLSGDASASGPGATAGVAKFYD